MNSFLLSFLVLILFLFHISLRPRISQGQVRECFCAIWCIDAVFAICGTILSFVIYRYELASFLTFRNIGLCLLYLLFTMLFLLIAPSGIRLFKPRKYSPEECLLAEYRFNDTLYMIRDFFLLLLFLVPALLTFINRYTPSLWETLLWDTEAICGAFSFVIFLILLPLSLRQALYWLKNLVGNQDYDRILLAQKHSTKIHYKHRNRSL